MGFVRDFFGLPELEGKTKVITTENIALPNRPAEDIRRDLMNDVGMGGVGAVQVAAVFACARVIAEGLAQVPCLLQRRAKSGGFEPATDHPLYDLLNRAPNAYQTSFEFREWAGLQIALTGNAYVFVSRDTRGRPIELIPLAAGLVTLDTSTFGEVRYRLNIPNPAAYTAKNVWHIRGSSLDGATGVSPQAIAARAIGLAIDLEAFGANYFKNGSKPSGILTTKEKLNEEQYNAIMNSWRAQQAGIQNAHGVALVTNGLEFQPMQVNANDAQFIEARRYQLEEICRVMRVNPVLIMQNTGSASYASVEQLFLAHQTHTLNPLYARFEQSAEVSLLTAEDRRNGYRVHLDSREMTRGNSQDRSKYLQTMVASGLMTRNEAREFEGLDRVNDPSADELTPAANLFGQPTDEKS